MKVKRIDEDTAVNIREKLKEVRRKTGLSMKNFGAAIGYTTGNIGDWESGKALPSLSALISISNQFDISLDWLLTGKEYAPQVVLDPDIQKLIEAYNLLNEENRNTLKVCVALLLTRNPSDILEEALSRTRYPEPTPEPQQVKESSFGIPILGTAAAGTPIMTEELVEGFIPIPLSAIKNRNTYVVKAKGNSMIEAGINNGDYVIICPQPTVENGEIALVTVDGEVTIKKFYRYDHEVRLRPANKSMQDIIVNDLSKIKILGKVVGAINAEKAEKIKRTDF